MTLDSRLLLLSPDDNCLIAAATLEAGTALEVDGETVVLPATVSLGHKLARRALTAGEKILRYGAPIGHATRDVAKGEHLHTHNLESDYLPTYTLDAGHAYVEHDD
ncbi:MAG TPA: UxaA family hydrolase [Trinickia sp.]